MKDRRIRPKGGIQSGRQLLERWIIKGRMTQSEAAEQIGISRVKLNQYLNAESRPSLETAIRIEDATGIGIRMWLVNDVSGSGKVVKVAREGVNEVNHNLIIRTSDGVKH